MGNPNIIEIKQGEDVLFADTSIRLSEGLRPRRIVLRELPGKYVTHMEFLRIDVEVRTKEGKSYDYVVFSHDGYDQGHYYDHGLHTGVSKEDALRSARADFEIRRR